MIPSPCSLLVVDNDPAVVHHVERVASPEFEVLVASSAEAAQPVFTSRPVDIILTDQNLPGESGVRLLGWVRDQSPRTVRLLMTGFASFENAVEAINCGQVFRYIYKPWKPDELLQILRTAARTSLLERTHEDLLAELRRLNLELERRVQQRTQELKNANHQLQQQNLMLQRLALTDSLTGLPNRRAIDQLARSELRRRSRYPGPLALALIDVDHFKDVNSRYLLPGGDQVLVGLSRTFVNLLRTVDTVGRVGGEEFMVVAPETDPDGAFTLGERIRSGVEESRYLYEAASISVTVSLGFAVVGEDVVADYEQLKHAAAAALQEAKQGGRNRCIVHPVTGRLAGGAVAGAGS